MLAGLARPARALARQRGACVPMFAALTAASLLAGCGTARQDAHEPAGTYSMEVAHASFPVLQTVARPATMALVVRNSGGQAAPNVAVTVDSFSYHSSYPQLASSSRPIWVIERGPGAVARPPVETQEVSQPGSGQTAYVGTWALGRLAPGATRTFIWRVVPVKAGLYTVHYTVAAGLAGKAKARTPSGAPVVGRFRVAVAGAPPPTYVDPSTGKVRVGVYPSIPSSINP